MIKRKNRQVNYAICDFFYTKIISRGAATQKNEENKEEKEGEEEEEEEEEEEKTPMLCVQSISSQRII